MDEEIDRNTYQAIIDTLAISDFMYPAVATLTETLEVKYSSSSTDLVLEVLKIYVSELDSDLDIFISDIVTLDTSLSTYISASGKEVGYDELYQADLTLTDGISTLIDDGYKVTYVINNSAQNFTIDDQTIADDLKVDNLDLELKMNTMVQILNTNTVYQGILVNYLDVEEEAATQATISTELDALNAEMDAYITGIGGGDPIQEAVMVDLSNRIDNKNSEAKDSAKRLDTYSKSNLAAGQSQNESSLTVDSIESTWAAELRTKQEALNAAIVGSSALLLASQADAQSMIDSLVDSKDKVISVALIVSLANDPNATVESLFNLLAAPIEATLLVANTAICALKAAQCALCAVKVILEKAIEIVGKIIDKALSLLNGDTDYASIISDLKDDIVDGFKGLLPQSACSDIQAQKQSDMSDVRTALAGTGLNDNAGSTALTDKQETWSDAITTVCGTHFNSLPGALGTIIADEFGDFVDELKASVENTVDNLYSLADGCSTCEPPEFNGLDLPSVKLPSLKFPDFVLKVPYLDSKIVKC